MTPGPGSAAGPGRASTDTRAPERSEGGRSTVATGRGLGGSRRGPDRFGAGEPRSAHAARALRSAPPDDPWVSPGARRQIVLDGGAVVRPRERAAGSSRISPMRARKPGSRSQRACGGSNPTLSRRASTASGTTPRPASRSSAFDAPGGPKASGGEGEGKAAIRRSRNGSLTSRLCAMLLRSAYRRSCGRLVTNASRRSSRRSGSGSPANPCIGHYGLPQRRITCDLGCGVRGGGVAAVGTAEWAGQQF